MPRCPGGVCRLGPLSRAHCHYGAPGSSRLFVGPKACRLGSCSVCALSESGRAFLLQGSKVDGIWWAMSINQPFPILPSTSSPFPNLSLVHPHVAQAQIHTRSTAVPKPHMCLTYTVHSGSSYSWKYTPSFHEVATRKRDTRVRPTNYRTQTDRRPMSSS